MIRLNKSQLQAKLDKIPGLTANIERKKDVIARMKGTGTDKVRRQVLSHFAYHGNAPTLAELASALLISLDEVTRELRALASEDLVVLSADSIRAAYPFSGRETQHVLTISKTKVFSLCALDALGTAPMLGAETDVSSVCPACAGALSLSVTPSGVRPVGDNLRVWIPNFSVRSSTPVAVKACPSISFFCDMHKDELEQWETAGKGIHISLSEAFALGEAFFGEFLS